MATIFLISDQILYLLYSLFHLFWFSGQFTHYCFLKRIRPRRIVVSTMQILFQNRSVLLDGKQCRQLKGFGMYNGLQERDGIQLFIDSGVGGSFKVMMQGLASTSSASFCFFIFLTANLP